MKKSWIGLAAVALAVTSLAARRQSADETEIRRVITDYYFNHGGDSTLLRQAFDTQRAHMMYVQADTLVDVPIPLYVTRVGSQPRPAPGAPQTMKRILMVDVSGTAAVAKLELRGSSLLVDYMSLLKVRGKWQIVGKIFSRMPTTP